MENIAEGRLFRLRERMAATATDLVALGPSSHLRWLLELDPHGDERPVMALVTANHIGVLMPSLNAASSRKQCDVDFYEWSDDVGPKAALEKLLLDGDSLRPELSVVLDETMRADFAFLLLERLENPVHRFTQDTIGELRSQKDEHEYLALKECARLNDGAFKAAFAALRNGVTEAEIRDVAVDFYLANGAVPEFCIVAFGENSAFPHHHTGNDVLEPEMAVLIDSGCRLNGYPSDMTRCAWYGQHNKEFEDIATIVEQAAKSALVASRPGTPCCEVDHAARHVIVKAGYGDAFLHRTGHGLGVDVHEPPYITASSKNLLTVGNVFSIEPGIYLGGKFGVRLEDVVILRSDRAEVLSELPLGVLQIDERS
jgi:Xaa-Pro aminopeptidase